MEGRKVRNIFKKHDIARLPFLLDPHVPFGIIMVHRFSFPTYLQSDSSKVESLMLSIRDCETPRKKKKIELADEFNSKVGRNANVPCPHLHHPKPPAYRASCCQIMKKEQSSEGREE